MTHRILSTLALAALVIAGCKDYPIEPQQNPNLLMNPGFTPSVTSTQNIGAGSVESWSRGTGTPQIAPGSGCDTTRGYIQMWGNADVGESITQALATPIQKGHTYTVTACVKWMNENPDLHTPYVKFRFVAFNQAPAMYDHWREDKPNVAVIGSIRTSSTTWETISTAEWTADSDYTGFSINVENDVPDNNTPYTVSWGHIDNVELREKGSSRKP